MLYQGGAPVIKSPQLTTMMILYQGGTPVIKSPQSTTALLYRGETPVINISPVNHCAVISGRNTSHQISPVNHCAVISGRTTFCQNTVYAKKYLQVATRILWCGYGLCQHDPLRAPFSAPLPPPTPSFYPSPSLTVLYKTSIDCFCFFPPILVLIMS